MKRRLHDLVLALDARLSPDDRRTVAELIDANEPGLALQTIGGALAEGSGAVVEAEREEIVGLADEMGISAEVTASLRPSPVSERLPSATRQTMKARW